MIHIIKLLFPFSNNQRHVFLRVPLCIIQTAAPGHPLQRRSFLTNLIRPGFDDSALHFRLKVSGKPESIFPFRLELSAKVESLQPFRLELSAKVESLSLFTLELSAKVESIPAFTLELSAKVESLSLFTLDLSAKVGSISAFALDLSAKVESLLPFALKPGNRRGLSNGEALMLIDGESNYIGFVSLLNIRLKHYDDILAQRRGRNTAEEEEEYNG